MKIKFILLTILVSIIEIISIVSETFATDIQTVCNFYITDSKVSVSKDITLISPDFSNEKNVVNKKIAPGTEGSFIVNINISQNTRAEYLLFFDNFSNKFPENLKFYLDGKEIDIYSFSLTNTQESKAVTYLFTWKWDYESADDNIDLEDSRLGDLTFDIILSTEYGGSSNTEDNTPSDSDDEKDDDIPSNKEDNNHTVDINKPIQSIQVLPRSGDITTNF